VLRKQLRIHNKDVAGLQGRVAMRDQNRTSARNPGVTGIRQHASFLMALLLTAPMAFAEISESLTYSDYAVSANNSRSLARALNNTSPIRHDGQTFHAYTTWRVNWHYRWAIEANGNCRIIEVSTGLNTTIQLPRLVGGSDILRERFQRYLTALNQHELGHHEIGRKAAREVDRQLQAMPAMSDCQRLSSAANKLAYRIVNRLKDEERTYDLVTVHGRLQGARLDY
jgi:predicted secreted Zn-dependent protease